MNVELSSIEARVIGCLMEKELSELKSEVSELRSLIDQLLDTVYNSVSV